MSTIETDHVFEFALAMPADLRARLAQQLLESLEADESIDRAWIEQVKRRSEEIDSGKVQALPGDEVIETLRALSRK